ncbi:MAG: hypothetical protein OEV74_07250 [Cyclobacteriaceae bacterium]|nr:hypothetical protein [Cyclobacteriaceae bacterium]MDH4296056.1 hypothetical protein [Cyclobacteriaceae bacterium]MDH5248326.1 hypothetical protein [Cyclobacteriaceae bacterium]
MKRLFFILLLGSFAWSCQKSKETTETTESGTNNALTAQRDAFFNDLMAPTEVAARLFATAAEFEPALMSDPNNYSAYAGNRENAAANMGIYLSDLNYSIAYGKAETTKQHFVAAHELSKTIGIESNVLEFLMQRYNANLSQNDSVKNVVTDLLYESTMDLRATDRERLAGIAMAAYQIENLHLALGTLESYPKDLLPDDARTAILVPLFKLVLGQRQNIVTIYNFIKSYSDTMTAEANPNYPFYVNALEELIAVYDKLNVDEKIANNQGVELMNDAVVMELSEKTNAIRNKIVSTE